MASGKQSKRRRAQVRTPEQQRLRRPGPRIKLTGVAVVLVIGIGAGLGVGLAGGSGSSSLGKVPARGSLTGRLALPQAASVQRLFAGIPQHGNVLGSSSASVTLAEYIDLQCPFCDAFDLRVLPDLVSRYVRPGKLRIEVRPIAFIGPDSKRGRAAAIAAGEQNRMFNFVELLYANQGTENTGWLDDAMVEKAAASIPGLGVPRLLADRKSGAVTSAEQGFDARASADHVRQTPTVLVGKTGGRLQQVTLRSPTDETAVVAAITGALR